MAQKSPEREKEESNADNGAADFAIVELLGTVADRLRPDPAGRLDIGPTMSFYDSEGRPVSNLIGAAGRLIGLRRTGNEIEIALFPSPESAKERQSDLTMLITYDDKKTQTTETRRIFAGGTEPNTTIKTTLDHQTGTVVIHASDATGEQKLTLRTDGRPLDLEVVTATEESASSVLKFSFTPQGEVNEVLLNGELLAADEAEPFIVSARTTIKTVASENGFTAEPADGRPDSTAATERTPGASEGRKHEQRTSTRVELPDGSWREFERLKNGTVTKITESGGVTWISNDGLHFQMVGSNERILGPVVIEKDGTYSFTSKDLKLTRNIDGEVLAFNGLGQLRSRTSAKGIHIGFEPLGAVTETSDASGNRRQFEHRGTHLSRYTEPDGSIFTSPDGYNWKEEPRPGLSRPLAIRTGFCWVTPDGEFTQKTEGRGTRKFRLDGSEIHLDKDNRLTMVKDVHGVQHYIDHSTHDGSMRLRREPRAKTSTTRPADDQPGQIVAATQDGEIHEKLPEDIIRVTRLDGWVELRSRHGVELHKKNPDGSEVVKDQSGNVVMTTDATGRKTTFKYTEGKLTAIMGQGWSLTSANGKHWRSLPDGTAAKLRIYAGSDGSLKIADDTKQTVTIKALDGTTIVLNAANQVIEATNLKGEKRIFGYDTAGNVNRVTEPQLILQSEWTSLDGKHWCRKDGSAIRKMQVDVASNGSYTETDLNSGTRTTTLPSGRVLEFDASRRIILDQHPDGSSTRWNYDAKTGKPSGMEIHTADGKTQWINDKNQVVRTKNVQGVEANYGYDGSTGKLNYYKEQGHEWKLVGANQWCRNGDLKSLWNGLMDVTPTGEFCVSASDTNTTIVYALDATRKVVTQLPTEPPTFTECHFGQNGKLIRTVDFRGTQKEYGRDAQGKLNKVSEQSDSSIKPIVWTSSDGQHWTSEDGKQKMVGTITITDDGTATVFDASSGRTDIQRLGQSVIIISPEDIDLKASAIKSAIRPTPTTVPMVSLTGNSWIDGVLDTVIMGGAVSGANAAIALHQDPDMVINLLKNLTEPERDALRVAYKKQFEVDLIEDLQLFRSTADCERAVNALNHKDGKPDYAGHIHSVLTERSQYFFGRTQANCEQDLRDTIAGMDRKAIIKLSIEYKQRFDISLEQAIDQDPNLSKLTKDALKILMNGSDAIRKNPELTLSLAKIALDNRDVALFQDAFRFASDEARQRFIKDGGEGKLRAAFGGAWYNIFIKGPIAWVLNANANITDTDLRHTLDYAEQGRLSVETQVADNTSWLGDSTDQIEHSLKEMTDHERQMYKVGRSLSEKSKLPESSLRYPELQTEAGQKQATEYYRRTHDALAWTAGVWFSPARQVAELSRWEDMIDVKGGSLVSRVSQHAGWLYNESDNAIFSSIEHMTAAEWQELKSLSKEDLKKKLDDLYNLISCDGFIPGTGFKGTDVALRCTQLVREKLTETNYEASTKVGWRSVKESLAHNINWYGNNYDILVETLEHMPASERREYYSSPDNRYRRDIDRKIRDIVPTGPAQDLLFSMLSRGSIELAPTMDPLDRLNLQILHSGLQRVQTNLAGGSPIGFFTDSRGAQDAFRAAGFVSNYPAEAVRDLSEMFAVPKRHQEFKHRYDTDQTYREQFDAAAHNLFPDSVDYARYITPLIETGRLPVAVLTGLREGGIVDDNAGFRKDFSHLSDSDRAALAGKGNATAALAFRNLSQDEREIATFLVAQGTERPEDLLRAYVVGFGATSQDLSATWSRLSPAERDRAIVAYSTKYRSSIHADLRATLGTYEAEDILDRPGTPEEAIDRMMQRYYRSYDGVGRWFVDTLWDGTGAQARNDADQLVAMLSDSSALGKRLNDSPEVREKIENLMQAIKSFNTSKEGVANAAADLALAIASVIGAGFTGGVSLSLLAGTAIGGAILKVLIKANIMGADYTNSDFLMDALTGAIDGALSVLGPAEIAAMCGVGEQAGLMAAQKTIELLGKEGVELLLREGAEELLEKELVTVVRQSIVSGTKDISEEALKKLATKLLAEGAEEAAINKATQILKQQLQAQLEEQMKHVFVNIAREYAFVVTSGALGAGASGTVRGVAEWDPRLSFAENMQRAATTVGTSTAFGGIGAAGFHTAFKIGGHCWESAIGDGAAASTKPASELPDGPGTKPGFAEPVHVDQPAPHTVAAKTVDAPVERLRTAANEATAAAPDAALARPVFGVKPETPVVAGFSPHPLDKLSDGDQLKFLGSQLGEPTPGTHSEPVLKPAYRDMNPAELNAAFEKAGVIDDAGTLNHEAFAREFLVDATDLPAEKVRIYKPEGYQTLIIIPESQIALHDKVRALRKGLTSDDYTTRMSAEAAAKANPDWQKVILPEDILKQLDSLPDKGHGIKKIVMADKPSANDAYRTVEASSEGRITEGVMTKGRFVSAAHANIEAHEIVIFPSTTPRSLNENLRHEWSHIFEGKAPTDRRLFDVARSVERRGGKPYYDRPYAAFDANTAGSEDWAVHVGEVMLGDQTRFERMVDRAKGTPSQYKMLVMANALEKSLEDAKIAARALPSADPGAQRELVRLAEIQKRIDHVRSTLAVEAKRNLIDTITSPKTPFAESRDAVLLLAGLGDRNTAQELLQLASKQNDPNLARIMYRSAREIRDGVIPDDQLIALSKQNGPLQAIILDEFARSGGGPCRVDFVARIKSGEIPKLVKDGSLSHNVLIDSILTESGSLELMDDVLSHLQDSPEIRDKILIALVDEDIAPYAARAFNQIKVNGGVHPTQIDDFLVVAAHKRLSTYDKASEIKAAIGDDHSGRQPDVALKRPSLEAASNGGKIEAGHNSEAQARKTIEKLKKHLDSDPDMVDPEKLVSLYRENAASRKQMDWLAHSLEQTPDSADIQKLINDYPYNSLTVAAHMNGVRSVIEAGDFIVFVHGTNGELSSKVVGQGTEALTGDLFTSSAIKVGKAYAVEGDNVKDPAIFGIAIPKKVYDALTNKNNTGPIRHTGQDLYLIDGHIYLTSQVKAHFGSNSLAHYTPCLIGPEYKFTPESFDALKKSAFFFPVDRALPSSPYR